MAGALLSTLTTGTLTGGEGGTISSTTVSNLLGAENYAIYDAMKDSITDRNYPRVYLNYLSFDESFNILPEECSITQMKGPDHVWNMLTQPGYICRKNGYVLAYVSNESDVVTFIDNTTFTIHYGQLQQEQHYYPHGLVLDAGLATGALKSNYLFEGNELQPHLNLQLSDFNYRQYDQQIGRFTSVDPLADASGQEMFSPYHFVGNDPANYTDPLGLQNTGCQNWYHGSTGDRTSFKGVWAAISGAVSAIGNALSQGGSWDMPHGTELPMNNDVISMAIGIHTGGGGGSTSVGTKFLKRDIKEQEEKNQNIYKQDMARNYGGSTERKGFVTFDHVTYDLPAFEKFYTKYKKAVKASKVTDNTGKQYNLNKAISIFNSDLQNVVPYAEVGKKLMLKDNIVTVDWNSKLMTSNDASRCEECADMYGEIIHIHLAPFTMRHPDIMKGNTSANFYPAIGPSPGDITTSERTGYKYFSVIVDEKYIYLYKGTEIHKFTKGTYILVK